MAQKRSGKPQKKRSTRKRTQKKKQGGFNFGKFTLGLFILIVLGYSGLAIWEGKLIIDEVSQFELPEFFEELDTVDEPGQIEDDKAVPSGENEVGINPAAELSDNFDAETYDLYFTKAFDFAWPAYSAAEAIIERPCYTIRYNEIHEQAMWVAYKLEADSLAQETFKRKDDFRKDPRVRTGSAELSDYKGSGYDRGHLAPAADFSYDEFALSQSFYMSNMSPQNPSFNRGIWRKLESQVRDWAKENTEIYVITGPVLENNLKAIGDNQVSIPNYYYKVILDIQKPGIKAIAFLMPNEGSSNALNSFEVSIDRLEELTKLDFFPTLPDELEGYLESGSAAKDWNY